MKNEIKPITTQAAANRHLQQQVEALDEKIAILEEKVGEITPADVEKIEAAVEKMTSGKLDKETIEAMKGRGWEAMQLRNDRRARQMITETLTLDLIFPDGRFLLLPAGERLISPSGFHPDQRVFVKPSAGALVDQLPKRSNMSYLDFTEALVEG